MPTPVRLADVVAALGGALHGDGSLRINRLAPLESADSSSLSFLANPRYAAKLAASAAGCVIVAPAQQDLALVRGAAIVTPDLPGNGERHAMDSPTRVAEMVEFCRQDLSERGIAPPYRLLAVGRFCRTKGFDILIDACAIMARKGFPFQLTLVGSGLPWPTAIIRRRIRRRQDQTIFRIAEMQLQQVQRRFMHRQLGLLECEHVGPRFVVEQVVEGVFAHRGTLVMEDEQPDQPINF